MCGSNFYELDFILYNILVLLDVQANLPETSPFLSAQMAWQIFIVLGMYNFVYMLDFAV